MIRIKNKKPSKGPGPFLLKPQDNRDAKNTAKRNENINVIKYIIESFLNQE
jgi:hypothetical protein